jgi:NAD(P)-dependent dehydrogenase (short-subunit alcohol dehydrogenase family)
VEWFGERPATAIVTGGASGIGRSVCELLAKDGYRVAVADQDVAGAEAVAHHIDGHAFAVDVSDEASVAALFDAASALFDGNLDAVATVAGIGDTTPFMDLDVATFRRTYDVNVVGTFLCIREAAKRMRSGGRICTVASVAGKRGGGLTGTAAYAASKGAVLALTRNAARVLAERGIAVNSVAPGATLTPMIEAAFAKPEHRARVEAAALAGRAAEPHEIAEAIVWLLSPRSSFVQGETLTIDGGLMLD